MLVAGVEMLLRILKQESGLAHATCALDAYQAVVPVYLLHKASTDWGISVFHQVGVSAEKSLHAVLLFFERVCHPLKSLILGKDNMFFSNCKVKFANYVFFS